MMVDIFEVMPRAEIESKLADTLTLKPSGANDTNAWNNAVNGLANGGTINMSHGDYYIDGGVLKSNTIIHGRGFPRLLSDTIIFTVNSQSADVVNNLNNITFEYVTFEAITKTFSEFIHLLSLSGVSMVTFKDCIFKGFKGDGVYLGSGDAGQERHNENIHFEKCIFDGVNFQNRNGLSILDGDGVTLEKCLFKNCTQPNMPGAIDIEPDANNWAILKNISVKKCKFKNIGGNTGVFNLHLPLSQSQLLTPVTNITFESNSIDGTNDTQSGIGLTQIQQTAIDNTSIGLYIKILNNKISNIAARPYTILGVKNVIFSKNVFENCAQDANTGYTGATDKCADIKLEDNTFKLCGTVGGVGVSVFTIDRLDLLRNTFEDCGKSDGTYGVGIDFNTGASTFVRLIGNDFISPTGKMINATVKEAGHTFTATTNTDQGNNYNGLSSAFVANLKNPVDLYNNAYSYDGSTLPDSFPLGITTHIVNSTTGMPTGGFSQGILVTHKLDTTAAYRKFTTQCYYPANNAGVTLTDNYYRRANSATNDWSAWYKVSGVSV